MSQLLEAIKYGHLKSKAKFTLLDAIGIAGQNGGKYFDHVAATKLMQDNQRIAHEYRMTGKIQDEEREEEKYQRRREDELEDQEKLYNLRKNYGIGESSPQWKRSYIDGTEEFIQLMPDGTSRRGVGPDGKEGIEAGGDHITPAEKRAKGLRNEYTKRIDKLKYIGKKEAFTNLKISYDKPSAMGDMAMIFNYLKVLDPDSTVRESEYYNVEKARAEFDKHGVPNAVRKLYQRLITGEKLLPEQRVEIMQYAQASFNNTRKERLRIEKRFKGLADYQEVDYKGIGFSSDDFSPLNIFKEKEDLKKQKMQEPYSSQAQALAAYVLGNGEIPVKKEEEKTGEPTQPPLPFDDKYSNPNSIYWR